MTPGSHGTTFGGNPLVTRSACAVLDIIKKEGLVENAATLGKKWMAEMKSIRSDKIKDVRGYGFMIGVELESNDLAVYVRKAMLEKGILLNICHGNVLRLLPPLILSEKQKDMFMSALKDII
jgi:acetylornithine/succinyldiaminopimelate/putrescine aminotransferase